MRYHELTEGPQDDFGQLAEAKKITAAFIKFLQDHEDVPIGEIDYMYPRSWKDGRACFVDAKMCGRAVEACGMTPAIRDVTTKDRTRWVLRKWISDENRLMIWRALPGEPQEQFMACSDMKMAVLAFESLVGEGKGSADKY